MHGHKVSSLHRKARKFSSTFSEEGYVAVLESFFNEWLTLKEDIEVIRSGLKEWMRIKDNKINVIAATATFLTYFFSLIYRFHYIFAAYLDLRKKNYHGARRSLLVLRRDFVKSINIETILDDLRGIVLELQHESLLVLLNSPLLKNFDQVLEFRNKATHKVTYVRKNLDKLYEKSTKIIPQMDEVLELMLKILDNIHSDLQKYNVKYKILVAMKEKKIDGRIRTIYAFV